MSFSMDNYESEKAKLEKNKAEAVAGYNFEARDQAELALEKLEQDKAEFEKLSNTEIPLHQKDQIEKLGGDLDVVKNVNEKIETEKEKTAREIQEAVDSLDPLHKDLFESLGANPADYMQPENTPEQAEFENLQTELQEKNKKHQETFNKIQKLEEDIEEIKKQKGYTEKLEELKKKKIPTEEILSLIMSNKVEALKNLNKLMEYTKNETDKEKLQTLINKVQKMEDQDIKDMAQNLSYSWAGISTAIFSGMEGFDYKNLGTILEDQHIGNRVISVEESAKSITTFEKEMESDPEIIELENQRSALVKQKENDYEEVRKVERQIEKLKEPK